MSNKTIVVITKDIVSKNLIDKKLGDSYTVIDFTGIQSSLDYIYHSLPDMIIIAISMDDQLTISILNDIKSDPIFGQLPVLALFDDQSSIPSWEYLLVDDYILKPCLEVELQAKVDLCLQRAERMLDVNPLTRLPGNIAIMKQIQKRLDSGAVFAVAYSDIDYFKPFNDKYGFSRGDEVLKVLGRLVLNIVKAGQPLGSFAGHIGGDDFVFIMNYDFIEDTAGDILGNFDKIIPTFYDSEDRSKRQIKSVDREGNTRTFPIMGLSIGIAHNKNRKFTHYGEIAEVASEMKKYAKSAGGSCLKIDKRQ